MEPVVVTVYYVRSYWGDCESKDYFKTHEAALAFLGENGDRSRIKKEFLLKFTDEEGKEHYSTLNLTHVR